MSLYLVRHAKAGSRSDWEGDDRVRPLSKNGWKQADTIAKRLRKIGPSTLHTSPYVRCRQTLEPLARLTDLDIVDQACLAEAEPFEPVLDLLAAVPDGSVLCSHGDIIPETIAALQRRGCEMMTKADWRKGTIWTIERGADGDFVSASVWGPTD
ncbi:MAG: phosphoglycerate mutase family protein [Ilumatobacteraceae bacterium]